MGKLGLWHKESQQEVWRLGEMVCDTFVRLV